MSERPVRVVFIAGVSHCGSTFLGQLLGQQEGFAFVGELVHTARALERGEDCGCGEPLERCSVWRNVFAQLRDEGFEASELALPLRDERARGLARHVLRERGLLGRSADLDRRRDALVSALRAVHATSGADVIVDSSKSPAYGYLLARDPRVELSVVHLVRDPRATAWSFQKSPELHYAPPTIALIWDVWNPLIETLWRRSPRYLRLRYDDFAAEPKPTLERIAALAGSAGAIGAFRGEHEVELTPTHPVFGNPNRFRRGLVEIRPDQSWREADELRGLRTVSALTLPLRARYGYR